MLKKKERKQKQRKRKLVKNNAADDEIVVDKGNIQGDSDEMAVEDGGKVEIEMENFDSQIVMEEEDNQ